MIVALAAAGLLLAAIPLVLFLGNVRVYRTPSASGSGPPPGVSVLIPARNEERGIVAAIESALSSERIDGEVIVLDDRSEDRTAALVAAIAQRDPRVRLISGDELPPGWCGKPHACAQLAAAARHDVLVFLDADVRLAPDGLSRMVGFLDQSAADLVSGVPRQVTGTAVESLVIPLIHFILLGFLPLERMRASRHPAYAAGCGQLFVTRRASYLQAGGHAAVRASLHDGLTLPRAYRQAGLATDLMDATPLASCRMYRSAGEVWKGLAKNAGEALAAPALIGPATLVLLGGQVLPVVLLLLATFLPFSPVTLILAAMGTMASYLPRLVGAVRFRQSTLGGLLHPAGVLILLAIQWWAFARAALGRPVAWKGRAYGGG